MTDDQEIRIKPDWLSWTYWPIVEKGYPINDYYRAKSFDAIYAKLGLYCEVQSSAAGRKPYTRKHKISGDYGMLFYNPKLEYCTVELTGKGCTAVMDNDGFEMIAEQALEHVTRFDVAIDFKTNVTPTQFVGAGFSERIKSHSSVHSDSGETCYIGSPTSDMMARVYKYEPPHERAGLLRIEFVARRKRAKVAVKLWLEQGPISAVAFMAATFGFEHELWKSGRWHGAVVDATVEHTRSEAKTIKWLLKQVKPALWKLANNGSIDQVFWDDFLDAIPHVKVTYKQHNKTITETTKLPVGGENNSDAIPWEHLT